MRTSGKLTTDFQKEGKEKGRDGPKERQEMVYHVPLSPNDRKIYEKELFDAFRIQIQFITLY